MLSDFRFGLKLLWKDKAFTLTALLTLALCIGANTAIFTVLNAVILNPLPYPDPGKLVSIYNVYPGVGVEHGSNGVPDYLDRKEMSDVFDSVALIGNNGYDMGSVGSPVRMSGEYVTPSYFKVLRTSPLMGRAFSEDDAVVGRDKSVILSYGLWKDMFARDANILGKDVRLSGVPYRIVGVMPQNFQTVGDDAKLWVPFAFSPEQTSDDARHSNSWSMIARLRAGRGVAYAQQRIDVLNKRNMERFPKYRELLEQARFGSKVVSLKDELVQDVRPTIYLLQAAVAFVLLIGCVNVANLMLVRSNIRMKEMAIRFSLGAARWRLARQLLTESVVLAAIGGLFGILTGFAGVRLLTLLGTKELPRGDSIQIDAGVLIFSGATAILTGLVFGSVPVYHLFRRDLNAVFRQTERTGTAQRGALWTRSALVICQVSLAFVLLIGAGLLTLSFARLLSVNPGFQAQNVLAARFSLPEVRYKDDAPARIFAGNLVASVRSLPGVAEAGAATLLPFGSNNSASVITVEGRKLTPGELPPVPSWNIVTAGYFKSLSIPLLAGRAFEERDSHESPRVAMIDQYLAKRLFPRGDAIGAKIRRGVDVDPKDPPFTIIGIAGNVKSFDLAERNPTGLVYFDYRQSTPRGMYLVAKAANENPQLATEIRRELQKIDPELPLFDVKTMPNRVSASMLNRRAAMMICLVFASLALVLSAIGIYGVLAYTVTQRRREFGIRMALGAEARNVIGMVIGQGLKLAGIGLAIGIAGAFALTRLMAAMLFEVKPTDPTVFIAVAAALVLVAVVASLIPSVRAVRVKPAIALRYE